MPFKSDKQREYFFAKLNSLPKGSEEYNKWKKVVDKFVAHSVDESQDLDEARRNPEVNLEKPVIEQINDFIQKHKGKEHLIFISFRDSINVTFINPKNEYETPTGLYTYPWKNYYENNIKNAFTSYGGGNLIPNLDATVPFAGSRKYMFLYKLKSKQGILTNDSTYRDTLPYANKLFNLVRSNEYALEIVNSYINDYQLYVTNYYDRNKFSRNSLGDIHKFWILLYQVAEKLTKGNVQNIVASLCRNIGVNGFLDLGTGYIHPNEKFQGLFFRGRDLFDDIKIIDTKKENRLLSSYKLNDEDYKNLEITDIKKILSPKIDRNNNKKNNFIYGFFKKAISVGGKDFINKGKNLYYMFDYIEYLTLDKGARLIRDIYNIDNNSLDKISIDELAPLIYYILKEEDLFKKVITKVIINDDLQGLLWVLDKTSRSSVLNDVIYLILTNDELRNILESKPKSFKVVKDYVNNSYLIYPIRKMELAKFLNQDTINSPVNEIFKSLTSLQKELNEQRKISIKQKNLEKVKQFLLEKFDAEGIYSSVEATAKALSYIMDDFFTSVGQNFSDETGGRSISSHQKMRHARNRLIKKLGFDIGHSPSHTPSQKNTTRAIDYISGEMGYRGGYKTLEEISEAYHAAKNDGSNLDLVKAVEDLLGKPSLTSLQEELNEQNKVNVKKKNLEKVKQFLLEKKGVISEDFKSQEQNYINQGNDPQIVKTYIERFRKIKDKNYKQLNDQIGGLENVRDRKNIDSYKTFKELETIVDYVGGQIDLAGASLGKDIEIDAKPIYEDDVFQIYYADSARACIKYKGNIPYGWCVSQKEGNMYYTYRYKENEPAFYFVKIKDRTKKELGFFSMLGNVFNGQFKDKYHFFIIQSIKGAKIGDTKAQQYIVTSAMNDGDKRMSWDEIVAIEPRIANLQKIFKSVELSPEDKEFYKRFKDGTDDETFCKLDYTSKRRYLDIYIRQNQLLTDIQFKCLPEDLMNLYVGFGVGLSEGQFELIKSNKNLLKRYKQITERKLEEFLKNKNQQITFNYTELLILPEDKVKNSIMNLDAYKIQSLLEITYSKESEKIINALINIGGKEFIMNSDSRIISLLLRYSSEPEKIINMLFNIGGKEFIMNLNSRIISLLLNYSSEPEKIIDILNKYGDNKGKDFIMNLSSERIKELLIFSSKPEKIINLLDNNKGKEFIMNLDWKRFRFLLSESKKPEKIINMLFNIGGKEFIMNLELEKINDLLYISTTLEGGYSKVNNVIDTLFNIGGKEFIMNLNSSKIESLLSYSSEPDNVIDTLFNIGGKEFIMNLNLNSKIILLLLRYSKEPEKIIDILNKYGDNKGKDFIMNLSSEEIRYLLRHSFPPEKIKQILQQYGKLPKDDSNSPINEIFNSLTSLQEELTEQRKVTIKETNLMKVQNFIKKKKNNQ